MGKGDERKKGGDFLELFCFSVSLFLGPNPAGATAASSG